MTPSPRSDDDRVFVKHGRRHYRRTYSRTEVRIGLVVLGVLALVVAWVAWRGAHPDPELFSTAEHLLQASAPAADRSPLPPALAGPGWTEGPVSRFGFDTLYEKIDGREDYYKTFGFKELVFVTLAHEADPGRVIDIECFDLGSTQNALGAYSGERSAGIEPEVTPDGSLTHVDRNALYLARGPYYVRAIGSEESQAVLEALAALRESLLAALPAAELPWAYRLFVGSLGLDPGQVAYAAENAFSFGFARDVHSALLPDGETEVFVVAAGTPEAAGDLASRFTLGFREYGRALTSTDGLDWTEDRYIGTVSGAAREGAWVIGVRGAPDLSSAQAALHELKAAVAREPQPGAAP